VDQAEKINCRWGVRIPLQDGVELSAIVYTPTDQTGPLPCIVAMTPYAADSYHDRGVYFAAHGVPFVIVDVRGRGNSGGTFRPFIQEGRDGWAVVEWLSKQVYCNGKVGMWGGSYLGFCQWATAKDRPPHLATIVPTASPHMAVDFPMRNNVFYPYVVRWLLATDGRAYQRMICHDNKFWAATNRKWHESGEAFRELDGLLGAPLPVFQEWLSHPEVDEYWDAYGLTVDQYQKLEIPILTITGIYDDDQPGALHYYREHMRHAPLAVQSKHYLVIGPWSHAGCIDPCQEFGGIKCAGTAVVDLAGLHLAWYSWIMQGGSKPEFLKDQVAYYVMGADHWRYASDLDGVTAYHVPYFLDSTGNASDVFGSGIMSGIPARGDPDSFRYDPRDTKGPEVAVEAEADGDSLVDQTQLFVMHGRQLVYHGPPFELDTEISGFFRLSLWLSIDCPDTDFYVSVHDIGLNGQSVQLTTDVMRARYRESLRTARLISHGGPLRYAFERFTFVAREIQRGHRLRLVISPVGRLAGTTFTERNCNSGRAVADESASEARPVLVRLFHDLEHPSVLQVPIGKPYSSSEKVACGIAQSTCMEDGSTCLPVGQEHGRSIGARLVSDLLSGDTSPLDRAPCDPQRTMSAS